MPLGNDRQRLHEVDGSDRVAFKIVWLFTGQFLELFILSFDLDDSFIDIDDIVAVLEVLPILF